MIEIHKIFNNMIDVYNDFFDSSHDLNLESQQDLVIPSVNNVLNGKLIEILWICTINQFLN